MSDDLVLLQGRRVLALEAEGLLEASKRLDGAFATAVRLIVQATGRVIVSGVGKSGLIARKIAATLTSTGTPASFLHPVESLHGDLGIVGRDDVAILLSKSGESEELLTLLSHLTRFGTRTIAITGHADSSLARACDASLDGSVREEACPHDLAPTTSTTVALALGDALAVAVLAQKGFQRDDFARLHPGGALGRKLILRVADVMEAHDLPVLPPTAQVREATVMLARRRGIVALCDAEHRIVGVFTAGDLTRTLERSDRALELGLAELMTRAPKVARQGELASAVVYRMEQSGIVAMPVINDQEQLVGVVHLHDLMRAGVA
ncbi:MAG: KpsF/GutQ family sugar-phosphate isomerase [Gemmatimonadetes bacterium]|nr:KpsF/GutQ family sugar-phosphate isomerase [Gemmatimonadota bacterium]